MKALDTFVIAQHYRFLDVTIDLTTLRLLCRERSLNRFDKKCRHGWLAQYNRALLHLKKTYQLLTPCVLLESLGRKLGVTAIAAQLSYRFQRSVKFP